MADADAAGTSLRQRALRAVAEAGRRVVTAAWPILQGTVAATAAWLIAKYGLDHPDPFFAPVAAVIALNATLGERGLHAVRLLYGVVVDSGVVGVDRCAGTKIIAVSFCSSRSAQTAAVSHRNVTTASPTWMAPSAPRSSLQPRSRRRAGCLAGRTATPPSPLRTGAGRRRRVCRCSRDRRPS